MSKDVYRDRISYPFVSSTGDISMVSSAVDDLVLWVPTESVLPFSVTALINNGRLMLEFTDSTASLVLTASEESGYIKDHQDKLCGIVAWNNLGMIALRSTLLGNDPQPYFDLYVHPSVCIPRKPIPLSTIIINGNVINGDNVGIGTDRSTGIISDVTDVCRLNMYASTQLYPPGTLKYLKVVNTATGDDNVSSVTYDLSGDVWLKSDPTCDIRVMTGDEITITEISNDKL